MSRANKPIARISSIFVGALALASFVLSYENLRWLAHDTGAVSSSLSWLWPFIIDGALIVFSLAVLRNSLSGESIFWPMLFVILFSALSVALNVIHSPDNLVARVITAIAPIALLLSFETLMAQIKADVKRGGALETLTQLTNRITEKRSELDEMIQAAQVEAEQIIGNAEQAAEARRSEADAELERVRRQHERLAVEVEALKTQRAEVKPGRIVKRNGSKAKDALLACAATGEPYNRGEIAKNAGVTPQAISAARKSLEDAGMIRVNTNGDGEYITLA